MATIEERVKAIATQRVGNDFSGKAPISEDAQYWHVIHSACYEAATEQDSIARAEEREECAQKVEDWYCYNMCEYLKTYSGCDWIQRSKCDIPEKIRKVIEKGGEG